MYGNLSTTTATSEINENVESMSRFLTTNRNIELLEPYEGKLSRTVLRGEGGSNALDLPDVQKQGDFFVESPIILFASIIWYLKIYQNGKFCTFPHAIEFLNRRYEDIFPILTSYPELENYLSPFMDAWLGGAAEQLMGQIASAKIPLSRMISPQLYWVMSDSEFTLDINNPEEPKILCVGNNPDRQNIYGAALGLYNSRIVKLINKKGMLKSSVIIDELPTIYFKGLDNLIATARSNKVAVCLGFQDFSQLVRDYGDKEAKVVMNTVGNIFSGQVVGETAKTLSERFGKVLQKRQSISINRQDVFHLHQHADGCAHSAEQDFRSDAGNVCRFGVRQLQRTYRTENFSLRDCGGCREGEAGGTCLQENSGHYRFHGRGRQRPHERNGAGELPAYQGRGEADCAGGTGAHRGR